MRAVIYSGAGGPEVITIGQVPKPEVRPEHIRVRVHAAGLNRADLIQRRGPHFPPPGGPAAPPGAGGPGGGGGGGGGPPRGGGGRGPGAGGGAGPGGSGGGRHRQTR